MEWKQREDKCDKDHKQANDGVLNHSEIYWALCLDGNDDGERCWVAHKEASLPLNWQY